MKKNRTGPPLSRAITSCGGVSVALRTVCAALLITVSPCVIAGGRENVVDEDFGWGVPGGGKDNPAEAGRKRSGGEATVGAEIVRVLKRNRRIVDYRGKIRKLLEEKQAIEQAGGEGRRVERKLQRLDDRIGKYEDRLARELDKIRKPYEKEYGKLKEKHASLEDKIAKLQEKGRNVQRYQKEIEKIEPRLEELDKILQVLEDLGKVDLNTEVIPEVARKYMSGGEKKSEKKDRRSRR